MAYQAWEIAYGSCEAWKYNLVRLEGPLSKGRDAARGSPAQRGEVRYFPCCVRATHVATPKSYLLEPYAGFKHTGIRLWAASGPWAPQRLATIDYSMRFSGCFPLPTGRDWAAKSFGFPAPGPFIRGVFRGVPLSVPTVASEKAMIAANAKKDKNAGATKVPPDVTRGKNADASAWTTTQDRPVPSPLGVSGLTADGSLHLDSPLPRGALPQKAPSSTGVATTFPSGASSKEGPSKGSSVNAFRPDHWRGPRRPRPRPEAPALDSNRESPAAPSSWCLGWNDWREWNGWEE